MANIIQAAEWMDQGLVVTIASCPSIRLRNGSISHIVKDDTLEALPWIVRTDYLLAEDWEIAH